MKSETVTFSGNTFLLNAHSDYTLPKKNIIEMREDATISTLYDGTLHNMKIDGILKGAGKIETSELTVQSGGCLIVPKSLEVKGNLVAAEGSEVRLNGRCAPIPVPSRIDDDDLITYYTSLKAFEDYGGYFNSREEFDAYIKKFKDSKIKIYETKDKILSSTTRFGLTGMDVVAIGKKRPPPPPPPPFYEGFDWALICPKIIFESGSSLNFNFADSYVPAVGDMILLANVPVSFGERVYTNLDSGWNIMLHNSTTAQYVGT